MAGARWAAGDESNPARVQIDTLTCLPLPRIQSAREPTFPAAKGCVEGGAEAHSYSLIQLAKLAGVEPRAYLREATLRAVRNPGTVTLARNLKSPEA